MNGLSAVPKGQFGYLAARKKRYLTGTLLLAVPIAVLLVLGILIFHTKLNGLTIPAMILVIPMANFLVTFIALCGMDHGTAEEYEQLRFFEEKGTLLSDLIIVNEKGYRVPCSFMAVYHGGLLAWPGWRRTKHRKEDLEIPVHDAMKKKGIPMRLKVYEDFGEFRERLLGIETAGEGDTDRRVELAAEAVRNLSL